MNEADILETTYEDSCIIERLTDIEDSNKYYYSRLKSI